MQPRAILVRAPNWIGDQVLAYPFYYYLRRAYPQARIVVSCVEWVADLQFRDLVDEVIPLPRVVQTGKWEKLKMLEQAARTLRQAAPREGFDLAISLPNSFSSAWLLARAGARQRRGYPTEGRGWLLHERLKWDPSSSLHRAQAYLDLLPLAAKPQRAATDFWDLPPLNDLDPPIGGELSRFDAAKSWPHITPLAPPDEPYWVLAPGATAESRRWPETRFLSLAKRVFLETGWRGLIVGGPKEAPLAERLCADSDAKLRDFTARGPASGLSQIFAQAQFTVCNESGLAHLAALCGSTVQIVCGAADPKRTRPLGPGKVQVAFNPIDCWPCERNHCIDPAGEKLGCLLGIQPESIWEEIRRALRIRS